MDGNDVIAVCEAAREAIATIRRTGKPFLLEVATYRVRGHYEPDDQAYVDPVELAHWSARDPIQLLERRLLESSLVTTGELEQIAQRARSRIEAAAAFAASSPMPAASELLTDVYA